MDLSTYLAAPGALTVAQLSRAGCAKQPAQVLQWKHGYKNRRPSAESCAALERESYRHGAERGCEARMECEDLRPDIAWVRTPDPDWPNPAGRPLVDVANASREAVAEPA